MHYIYKQLAEQKAWYEAHKNTATQTELQQGAYKPLTEARKQELLQLVEDMKARMIAEDESMKEWHERMYEQQASRYDS